MPRLLIAARSTLAMAVGMLRVRGVLMPLPWMAPLISELPKSCPQAYHWIMIISLLILQNGPELVRDSPIPFDTVPQKGPCTARFGSWVRTSPDVSEPVRTHDPAH